MTPAAFRLGNACYDLSRLLGIPGLDDARRRLADAGLLILESLPTGPAAPGGEPR